MRPIKLTMCAFGSYAKETVIDYSKLRDASLYLITGDTGAGKTTIFDAITFALYGTASGSTREAKRFRSNYASPTDDTYVELIFEYKGKEYFIRRSPAYKRASKRGDTDKLVEQTADGRMSRYMRGLETEIIASKDSEVTKAVEKLLGVNADQFCQMSMLAQGEFQRFLLAPSKDKKEIFRELFRTKLFDDIKNEVVEDCKALKSEIDLLNEAVRNRILEIDSEDEEIVSLKSMYGTGGHVITDGIDVLLEALQTVIDSDKALCSEGSEKRKQLDKEIEELQQRLDAGKRRVLKETQKSEITEELKKVTGRKEKLESDSPAIDIKRKETEADNIAKNNVETTLPDYDELDRLTALVEELTIKLEKAFSQKEDTSNKKDKAELELKANSEAVNAIGELKLVIDNDQKAVSDNMSSLQQIESIGEKINETNDLTVQYGELKEQLVAAEAEYSEADAVYNRRYRSFLRNQAGILARDFLTEGAACPVCGSTDHPAIAKLEEDAPTENEINKLKDSREQAGNVCADISKKMGSLNASVKEKIRQIAELMENQNIAGYDAESDSENGFEKGLALLNEKKQAIISEISRLKEKLTVDMAQVDRLEAIKAGIGAEEDRIRQLAQKIIDIDEAVKGYSSEMATAKGNAQQLEKRLKYASKAEAVEEIRRLEAGIKLKTSEIDIFDKELKQCGENIAKLNGEMDAVVNELKDMPVVDIDETETVCDDRKELREKLIGQISAFEGRVSTNEGIALYLKKNSELLSEKYSRYSWLLMLRETVAGNVSQKAKIELETYAQMSYFERVLQKANIRLVKMTDNRFSMIRQSDDTIKGKVGLDISVRDHYNSTDRPVNTLSGGETFLASMALALGLADEITESSGGIQMDSLFIDEGFGSLDEDILQITMDVLHELAEGNRQIGIISHVHELAKEVDRMICITKGANGCSMAEVK